MVGGLSMPPVTQPRPTDERERGHADLAALLGAVAVIALTLLFQPGPWGYTSTIVGAVVLCVLIAFFARYPSDVGRSGAEWWSSIVVAVSFAALVGIAGAITGAWPLQDHLFADSHYCRAIGVNAATSAVHDLTDKDLGVATLRHLHRLIKHQLDSPTPVDDNTTLRAIRQRRSTGIWFDGTGRPKQTESGWRCQARFHGRS